ncbi:MAG: hypothetical protein ABI868_24220 [Acidobacteriota bacterium]
MDDYCPRERRVTNHAIVAMIGPDVKQTRCSTCDTEHEYKQAKVPRQRRKSDTAAALYSQVLAGGPKRVSHESGPDSNGEPAPGASNGDGMSPPPDAVPDAASLRPPHPDQPDAEIEGDEPSEDGDVEQGPVHRPLIRATLPRTLGTPPPTRPAPEFTIRQPTGRQGRFRPRQQRDQRGPSPFQGNSSGNNMSGGGMPRQGGGRPPTSSRPGHRHGGGHKRSK